MCREVAVIGWPAPEVGVLLPAASIKLPRGFDEEGGPPINDNGAFGPPKMEKFKKSSCKLFSSAPDGTTSVADVAEINPYLIPGPYRSLVPARFSPFGLSEMVKGNYPVDGGHLLLSSFERDELISDHPEAVRLIRPFIGSSESIRGLQRYCLWIDDEDLRKV